MTGPFAESQPDHPKALDFSEDNYVALKSLLRIIYLDLSMFQTSYTLKISQNGDSHQ
jgi:hypothetical protein